MNTEIVLSFIKGDGLHFFLKKKLLLEFNRNVINMPACHLVENGPNGFEGPGKSDIHIWRIKTNLFQTSLLVLD